MILYIGKDKPSFVVVEKKNETAFRKIFKTDSQHLNHAYEITVLCFRHDISFHVQCTT
jgi:hypothetical protein